MIRILSLTVFFNAAFQNHAIDFLPSVGLRAEIHFACDESTEQQPHPQEHQKEEGAKQAPSDAGRSADGESNSAHDLPIVVPPAYRKANSRLNTGYVSIEAYRTRARLPASKDGEPGTSAPVRKGIW